MIHYAGIILRIIGSQKNRELFQNNRYKSKINRRLCESMVTPVPCQFYSCTAYTEYPVLRGYSECAIMANRDSDQPGCSLVDSAEALDTVVTVEAEIRTNLELESSCVSRIIF